MSVCHCRLVHSGKQPTLSGAGDILTFGTRSGTRHGVEAHVFRVQTSRDLATWTHALVQGVSNAVLFVREVSTGNYYQDYCVDACLHFTARCKTDCTAAKCICIVMNLSLWPGIKDFNTNMTGFWIICVDAWALRLISKAKASGIAFVFDRCSSRRRSTPFLLQMLVTRSLYIITVKSIWFGS